MDGEYDRLVPDYEGYRTRKIARSKGTGEGGGIYDSEPPGKDPLLTLENVIATPHVAALTKQVVRNMDLEAALNAIEHLNPAFQNR